MPLRCLLLLCLLSLTAAAQSKIEGIGKFKIGKTSIGVIQEVANEIGVKVGLATNISELYGPNPPSVIQVATNTDDFGEGRNSRPTAAPYCSEVKVYYISRYSVAGVELEGLYLTFREDTLTKLLTEDYLTTKRIVEALTTKFGPGTKKDELEKTTCIIGAGGPLSNHLKMTAWENGDIIAMDYTLRVFDATDNCKIVNTSGFSIDLKSQRKWLADCERSGKAKARAVKQSADKKALKDF